MNGAMESLKKVKVLGLFDKCLAQHASAFHPFVNERLDKTNVIH